MTSRYNVLSDDEAEHFLEKGYVVLRGCFSRQAAAEFTAGIWERLGYSEHDTSTWEKPSVHLPSRRKLAVRELAPKVWGAVCDLVGGQERIARDRPYEWNDSFIVNLFEGADRPWEPASPGAPGWHKDGDFFRHYLDSPEQGLLTLVLWSDVRHQGGATFVASDSVAPVARFLADHPEGAYPAAHETGADGVPRFRYDDLVGQCAEFVEATGEAGDVYLLHPYLLHAKAQNVLRWPRFISNPPLTLAEPMRFDRADPDDHSLVERAVLRGLGVPRHDFAPAGPREAVVPARVALQRQMLADEQRRLAA